MSRIDRTSPVLTKGLVWHFYQDRCVDKKPPYSVFQVKDFDCVTTLYESGKVMFQGIGADIEASYWTEQERVINKNIIDTTPKEKEKKEKDEKKIFINEASVGSDEVGTGDYFGPIVVTASLVKKEDYEIKKVFIFERGKFKFYENILDDKDLSNIHKQINLMVLQ